MHYNFQHTKTLTDLLMDAADGWLVVTHTATFRFVFGTPVLDVTAEHHVFSVGFDENDIAFVWNIDGSEPLTEGNFHEARAALADFILNNY